MRNPWGNGVFTGDWSNGSNVWGKAPPGIIEAAVEASGGLGGAALSRAGDPGEWMASTGARDPTCSWMAYEDFVKLFDLVRELLMAKFTQKAVRGEH